MSLFADIVLPVPLQKTYTYEVPASMASLARRGCRALVQFGKKRYYAGIILTVHDEKPPYETKPISEILDTTPVVTEEQLALWQWIADYYICTLGEVMKAGMPSGLKLESESRLLYNALFDESQCELTPRQSEALAFVREKKSCTISELGAAMGGINPIAHVKTLLDTEAIFISEELRDAYKPKTIVVYRLVDSVNSPGLLDEWFARLEKKPRQMETLMAFLQLAGGMGSALQGRPVSRETLSKDSRVSLSSMDTLVADGLMDKQRLEVSRLKDNDSGIVPPNTLTPEQQTAYEEITSKGSEGKPVLLHGVTSSGKTEVYIHLISRCLDQGRNTLYLLPEIALTTQITQRLRRHFGNQMVVYHSKFNDAERVEVWKRLLSHDSPRLVLGVRSSVLLPLKDLGLIIVDEEHESSFKQYDPAPRYNARDMAVVMGYRMKALTVLGSATPSLESYLNATTGKYALVQMTKRHAGIEMPSVEVIDMQDARTKRKTVSMFSFRLKEIIDQALARKEQVILFQNRRGFSPVVECKQCAYVPKCQNCDVSLTYHKGAGQLVCHYCGFVLPLPPVCPACGNPSLRPQGFGTEKIEEACKELFPQAKTVRMDLDTARSRHAFEDILTAFAAHKFDILIGTQMVSKGLDFEGVSTVGVMNADAMLNMPDFRADERSFQLMAQVSGRAGRAGKRGQVFIQSTKPDHPVIRDVAQNDFESSARRLLAERQAYRFPPFCRMVSLTLKHRDQQTVIHAAQILVGTLRNILGSNVSGPVQPVVGRVSNLFLQEISVKIVKSAQPHEVKRIMMEHVNALLADQAFRSIIVRIDVDPY